MQRYSSHAYSCARITLENVCHYEYTGIKSSREIWALYSNLQVEKKKRVRGYGEISKIIKSTSDIYNMHCIYTDFYCNVFYDQFGNFSDSE